MKNAEVGRHHSLEQTAADPSFFILHSQFFIPHYCLPAAAMNG